MLIKTGDKFIDLGAAATAEIIPGANRAIGLKCRDSASREIGTLGGAQSLDVEAGGKLLDAATGCLHDGVDGAKQAVLHAAQAAWDSEHPGEPELNPAIVEQRVEPIKLVGGRRHAR